MERVSAQRLAEWAAEARERWSVPGIAVGVLYDAEVTTAADGVCELGRPKPVSAESLFRIASITKPFVATLAMTLVQDGLLDLDKPPAGSAASASVRQLLSHQGGLATEWPVQLDASDDSDEALFRLVEGEPARLPTGAGGLFSYCNAGFWLVAAGIARTVGTSFEEAMGGRVLEPLGLTSTSFVAGSAARGHKQVAPGADEHEPVDYAYPRARRASGGLWSSVGDLLRFAEHHLGGPGPLTAETVAQMQQSQISAPGGSYGLGWFLRESAGRQIVQHTSSAAGFESLLLLVPDERCGFAALSNSSRGSAAIRELLERLGVGSTVGPDFTQAPEQLAAFGGTYTGNGLQVDVVPENGRLRVQVTSFDPFAGKNIVYPAVLARPVAEREFEVVDGELRGDRFTFPRDGFVCMGVLAARTE